MSLRRGVPGYQQYPALDTKYEETKYNESKYGETKYNESHYLVDDAKFALDTEDSKSFDHLMPSSGYISPICPICPLGIFVLLSIYH